MTPQQRVWWVTGKCFATVIRTTEFGDVIVKLDRSPVPITTRECFLQPSAS